MGLETCVQEQRRATGADGNSIAPGIWHRATPQMEFRAVGVEDADDVEGSVEEWRLH